MRIWDISPTLLCRAHLAAEHRELHGLWNILTLGKMGYSRHPETLRWHGKFAALHKRHEKLVTEMTRRGWTHRTPLDVRLATGSTMQRTYIDSPARQRALLTAKPCTCFRS